MLRSNAWKSQGELSRSTQDSEPELIDNLFILGRRACV